MKPKTMVLMILAIVCGLVASYMTSQLIAQNKEEAVVLTTKDKMTQWSSIRNPEEQFQETVILKKNAPQNAVHPPDWKTSLKGRRLRATVDGNTILTEDHLLKKEVTGIDAMLEKGKRAMSITITAEKAVGYFVVPGSKVDVIHTVNGIPSVLLENVLVLAIDLNTTRSEERVGQIGATATLQMDNTEQVLKLSAARDKGQLSLVMRPPGDEDKKAEENTAAAIAPPPPVAPPPPPFEEPKEEPKTPTIEKPVEKVVVKAVDIINGAQDGVRYTYKFDKDGQLVDVTPKKFEEIRAELREKKTEKQPEKAPEKVDDK